MIIDVSKEVKEGNFTDDVIEEMKSSKRPFWDCYTGLYPLFFYNFHEEI